MAPFSLNFERGKKFQAATRSTFGHPVVFSPGFWQKKFILVVSFCGVHSSWIRIQLVLLFRLLLEVILKVLGSPLSRTVLQVLCCFQIGGFSHLQCGESG